MNPWACVIRRTAIPLILLLAVGCTGAPAADPAPGSAPAVSATPAAGTDQPGPASQLSSGPNWPIKDAELTRRVEAYIKDQGIGDRPPVLYDVKLGKVPQGYSHMVLAVTVNQLFLFAADAGNTKLQPVARVEASSVNVAKLMNVSSTESRVTVSSQMPFRATLISLEYEWDGTNLRFVREKVTDPTAESYARVQQFIDQGDLDGLMAGGGEKGVLYPDFYREAWSQPPQILKLAYEKSLAAYRAGKLADALRYLEYGLGVYGRRFGEPLKAPVPAQDPSNQYRLQDADLVPMVNDYAFFLAESGKLNEAEPLLQRVIEAAPNRTVALLNLADVQWGLGRQELARPNYRKYLELLGPERAKAPARAAERAG